jgi:hypothetical protein
MVHAFQRHSDRINRHQPCFSRRIIRPTAPQPVPRMIHQVSSHRIRIHILQFLSHLLLTPHVEIVEPSLPKRRCPHRVVRKCQRQSSWRRLLPIPRSLRETFCFSTCGTFDGVPFFGSVRSKCTCSGITTYSIGRKTCRERTSSSIFTIRVRVFLRCATLCDATTDGCGHPISYLHGIVPDDILPPCRMTKQNSLSKPSRPPALR